MASVNPRVLPGYRLSLGYTMFYMSLLVLIPLAGIYLKSFTITWSEFLKAAWTPRAIAAYKLTFGASVTAAGANIFIGLLLAWVLVRYDFPLKRFFDALIDLPFALPTAVAGLVYSTLYAANGWYGRFLAPLGIEGNNTRLGIVLVLIFTGMPFVVRTVQPVLESLDVEVEEAATTLGASRFQVFLHIIWPTLMPATLTGFALAFARALGEYGSVIFIAGNRAGETEIAPILVMNRLLELDDSGKLAAIAIAVVLLTVSFLMLALINLLEWWRKRRGA